MDDKQELRLRRQALRWRLKGIPSKVILEKVHRSPAWLSKWQKRLSQRGVAGLRSLSRRPHHLPTAYPSRIVRLLVQTRHRLVKQKVGLIGPRAIRRELRKVLDQPAPSLATIKRVLQRHDLVSTSPETSPAYFPKPLMTVAATLHAMDWTCRYLEDGPKVYAFHTLNLRTRACAQPLPAIKAATPLWAMACTPGKPLESPSFCNSTTTRLFVAATKRHAFSDSSSDCVCIWASN